MLLIQNVTDEVKAGRAMIEKATKAFLRSGGRIEKVPIRSAAPPNTFNGATSRSTASRRSSAALAAKMEVAMPEILRRHRSGARLSQIAKDHKSFVPTIKRYLLDAGEDPHANIKNYDLSFEQLLAIREMTEGGAAVSDVAKWTGLPRERVERTVKEFKFTKR